MKTLIQKRSRLFLFFLSFFLYYSVNCGNYTINTGSTIFHTQPTTLTLLTGQIMMVNSDGIYLYNSELKNEVSLFNFTTKLTEPENVRMEQFSSKDGGYILIIAQQILYIFTKNGVLKYSYTPPYSKILVLYNKTGNDLYYILGDLTNPHGIGLYKFDLSTREIYEISINSFNSISYTNFGYSCATTAPTDINRLILTCIHLGYGSNGSSMFVKCFDVQNNFNDLTDYNAQEDITNNGNVVLSKTNEDKTKVFILMGSIDGNTVPYTHYKVYDVNLKNFSIRGNFNTSKCNQVTVAKFKLYYFRKTDELLFTCQDSGCVHYVFNIALNFSLIYSNSYYPNGGSYVNTFSMLYSSQQQKYLIIVDLSGKIVPVTLNDFETQGTVNEYDQIEEDEPDPYVHAEDEIKEEMKEVEE